MVRALVPLVDGFEELEAIAVIDLLRRAGVSVITAGLTARHATGSHAVTVQCDSLLEDELGRAFSAIVLPGGPGVAKLVEHEGLREALKRQAAGEGLIAAICAAPLVLHAAGLLAGRRVACFPSIESRLTGATVLHESVVVDGRLVTSRGAGTAVQFALAVAEQLVGKRAADDVAKAIIHSEHSTA